MAIASLEVRASQLFQVSENIALQDILGYLITILISKNSTEVSFLVFVLTALVAIWDRTRAPP